jgi:hypothetical protein
MKQDGHRKPAHYGNASFLRQYGVSINTINNISEVTFLFDQPIPKNILGQLPKWFVGNYGRSIVMKGVPNEATSFFSLQLRRVGFRHGGRFVRNGSVVTMFITLSIENSMYYYDIIKGIENWDDVQNHYNDIFTSPAFYFYKKLEPFLINLGK